MTVTFNHKAAEKPITINDVVEIKIKKDRSGKDRYFEFIVKDSALKTYDINFVYDMTVKY